MVDFGLFMRYSLMFSLSRSMQDWDRSRLVPMPPFFELYLLSPPLSIASYESADGANILLFFAALYNLLGGLADVINIF